MENVSISQKFSFEWSGGFSYLTYLKKKHEITITEQLMEIESQNLILGAFPTKKKRSELCLHNIKELGLQSKINWFDLAFGILFALVTIFPLKLWFLIFTLWFLYRAFNTEAFLVDQPVDTTLGRKPPGGGWNE
ncbi:hypothetical protein [Paenibacillus sp. sgz302251]|uniref:hypothetical protein n=1 Tax=Paenibacillus sp. sgz302251 TaxID=3414493 RepID=UPI003C7CBAA9